MSLPGLLLCVVVVASALMLATLPGTAQSTGGDRGRDYGRRDSEWRPMPPLVHGYWGRRRWQRYSQDDGIRPGTDGREDYDRGWR